MMTIIQALHAAIKSLQNLHDDSLAFTQEEFSTKQFDKLNKKREHWLKTYRFFDTKLEQIAKTLTAATLDYAQKRQIEELLQKKDLLLARILEIDRKILDRIEGERVLIERTLASDQRSKDTLSRFKSTWITETGEGIDTQL